METNIIDYIRPELLTLIPALYILGAGLKKSSLKDKLIPLVLGGAGIILATAGVITSSGPNDFYEVMTAVSSGIIQGILCAGASVYSNQLIKQLLGGKE